MSKKVLYQKNTLSTSKKCLIIKLKKIPYQKTLPRILKSALSFLKKIRYQKNLTKNLKKVPYQEP